MGDDSCIDNEIIEFAKREFKINEVLKKPNSEGFTYYLFFNPPRYDNGLQSRMLDLDLELSKKTEKYLELLLLPQKLINDSEFEKVCKRIYSINN